MLLQRILVIVVLLPFGVAAIILGGWMYVATVFFFLLPAAYEYTQLLTAGGFRPAGFFVIGGSAALIIGRMASGFASDPWLLCVLILGSMAYHMFDYERGRDQAASDFALTIAGFMYIGWIGGYFVSLYAIPNGNWWMLLVLASVWVSDSAAYSVGRRWGRHKLAQRLSPKKSWEGYLGGIGGSILTATLLSGLLGMLTLESNPFTLATGAFLGLCLGVFPILGDLGESMIKRQVGAKDSGTALPGHGGFFDRIDSWLWSSVIGYYVITILFV